MITNSVSVPNVATTPDLLESYRTEIGRISVVMCDSDHFVDGKLQLTHYRDLVQNMGFFWVGTFLKTKKRRKTTHT